MDETLITSEVDFAAPGKQCGFLRLPHSVHRSAYGFIPVPVVTLANGKGPVILLMAGNHGDEYEGQIALSKLARELIPQDIQGRIILLTMANFPAAEAGTRTSPIDAGNLNRAFPGDARGTPTEMMAHYIEEVLLPKCDYMIDLHSGGSSLYYPPTLLRGQGNSAPEAAALKAVQAAFDLPYAWVFTDNAGRNSTGRTSMAAANRKGIISVLAELGGGGAVTPDALHRAERGLRRILHSLGMLPSYQPDAVRGTRELSSCGMVYAYHAGVFEPFKDIADAVAADEVVGRIHHPDAPWLESDPVTSPYAGIVLCKRAMGQVARGDTIYQIAADIGR